MENAAPAREACSSKQRFTGTNNTSGGSVFQGSIRTKSGAVNINLGGDVREQRRLEVLAWLSTVQYFRHHKFVKSKRLKGTGEWLLQRVEYQQWANAAGSAVFWLYGIPGAGKTELASLVIDTETGTIQPTTETAVLYFYCGNDESDRRSSTYIVRTLLHQIVCISSSLFEMVDVLYEKNRTSGFSHGMLDFADTIKLLTDIFPKFKKVFIIIDALDECDVCDRANLLDAFEDFLSCGNVNIFVTSRFRDDISLALDDHAKLLIKTQDVNDDISLFVDSEIKYAIRRKRLLRGNVDHELQQRLKRLLIEGANGMFLWARLQIGHLCDAISKPDLLLALEELPSGLRETYDRIWTKIQEQRPARKLLAEQTLELLLYSVQPLSANAVAQALTFGHSTDELDSNIVDVALILDVCQNLFVHDPELGILRPIHLTAQAFLKDHLPEGRSHSRIAVNCLRRISVSDTLDEATKTSFNHAENITDFTVYANLNWPVHVDRSDRSSEIDSLERNIMTNETLHRRWIEMLRIYEQHSPRKLSLLLGLLKAYPRYPVAALISACFFGLSSVDLAIYCQPLEWRIQNSTIESEYFFWRPNSSNPLSLLASDWRIAGLLCASEQGHDSIVAQLLQYTSGFIKTQLQGVIPRRLDTYSLPYYAHYDHLLEALACCIELAIAGGHIKIVKAFLELLIDDHFHYKGQSSPYSDRVSGYPALAAFLGQKEVVELLLNNGFSTREESHLRLYFDLSVAAGWKNEKVFALLLNHTDNDVDLTLALDNAASANNERVIELILDRLDRCFSQGELASEKDWPTSNALIKAAWGGCGAAARALCRDSRVNLCSRDESGMNALQIAVLEAHTDFLESLLERNDLDVNIHGRWGETPLILAVRKGHTAVVRLLLNSGRADPSLSDAEGLTAMDIAVMKDHQPIINLLSQTNSSTGEPRLHEDVDASEDSPSVAQPLSRWAAGFE